MSATRVKGWCPSALRPMLSGDGLLVRVRPQAGRLTQVQAAGIAALANKFGNGLLDLTSRANLQIRGVEPGAYPDLLEGLRALELLDPNPAVDARSNILVSPFAKDGDGTHALATDLAHALASPDAPALPGKFGFAVDCGEYPVLRESSADIRIERALGGCLVSADGFATGALVCSTQAVAACLELVHWYLTATTNDSPRGRMARLATKCALPARFQAAALPAASVATPHVGPTANGWLVGIEFGQLNAKTLAALSTLGDLGITPWRLLLIDGTQQPPHLEGIITDANDTRLRVVACIGSPACMQAHMATRPLARALAPFVPVGHWLHISGCAKGCAHPKDALTLIGTPNGISLVRHGKASSTPDVQTLGLEAISAYMPQFFENSRQHALPV